MDYGIAHRWTGADHAPNKPCTHRDEWAVAAWTMSGLKEEIVSPWGTRAQAAETLRRMRAEQSGEAEGHWGLPMAAQSQPSPTTPDASVTKPVRTRRASNPAPQPLVTVSQPDPAAPARRCAICGGPLRADARPQARTCGTACRQRRHRAAQVALGI